MAKAICMSPQHPDSEANGERSAKLEGLPGPMYVKQGCVTAGRDDPRLSRTKRKRRDVGVVGDADGGGDGLVQSESGIAVDTDCGDHDDKLTSTPPPSSTVGHDALHKMLEEVQSQRRTCSNGESQQINHPQR